MAPWLKSSSESHWNVKETNELRHFKFLHSIFFNLLHSCFDKRTWLQHEHGDHGRSEFYNFHLHLVADCVWSIGSSPVQKTCAELIKTDQNCTKWSTLSALTCNNPKRERERVCVCTEEFLFWWYCLILSAPTVLLVWLSTTVLTKSNSDHHLSKYGTSMDFWLAIVAHSRCCEQAWAGTVR